MSSSLIYLFDFMIVGLLLSSSAYNLFRSRMLICSFVSSLFVNSFSSFSIGLVSRSNFKFNVAVLAEVLSLIGRILWPEGVSSTS